MDDMKSEGGLFGEGLRAFKTIDERPHKAPIVRAMRKRCDPSTTNKPCIVCALVKTRYNQAPGDPPTDSTASSHAFVFGWTYEPPIDMTVT
jgi:hypothetical protein